jgi:hypothetical protein
VLPCLIELFTKQGLGRREHIGHSSRLAHAATMHAHRRTTVAELVAGLAIPPMSAGVRALHPG